MRPDSNAFETVRTIASWPIRSSNVAGRYLRASTRYPAPWGLGAAPRSRPGSTAWHGVSASLIVPPAAVSARHQFVVIAWLDRAIQGWSVFTGSPGQARQ